MIKAYVKVALISGVLLLPACVTRFNGAEHAQTYAEAHPISVDSQTVTLTIDADPTTTDLSTTDKARLRAFADAYMRNGHGPIAVTAPSGTGADVDGQEMAADIRGALNSMGVPWDRIAGATYRTGDRQELVVSYTRYVATASECGVWQGMKERDDRNLRSPNMGCATQNNLAAMIADPHDLIAPAAFGARDAATTVRAFEAYRAGEVTISQTDQTIETQVSD
ncbi:MAG: CpaD family pilus assembly protein [Pseudomonadota bacterium]